MRPDENDRELERLREASERVAANLVELEIDSSRQLVEASTLTGESAERWSAASAALTELWEWRGLLERFIERAQELRRSPRHGTELRELLTGESIELSCSPVPLAERDLLGSAEVSVRCTADELLERMSRAFDGVKAVVAEIGRAWETLTPRLTTARATLEQAQALAASLDEPARADLARAADLVSRLTAALRADPLSVAAADVDGLSDSLEAIRRELDAAVALRGALDASLADSAALVAQLRAAVDEARAAHEELLIKIAVPTAPAAPELPADMDGQLEQITALARSGAWHDARRRLDRWTTDAHERLDEARRIVRANQAPIDARNQLRALLEAYQVKAGRLGAVEDPELERIHAQAHQALHTAPSDLAFAARLVRRYQEILNATQPAPEAIR